MPHQTANPAERIRRRGSILLLVLVAVTVMALCTMTYLEMMHNEHRAAHFAGRQQQARLLAESGVAYLQTFLESSSEEIYQDGGLWDNRDVMQAVIVVEDVLSTGQGRFTIVTPDLSQGYYSDLHYGLENESAKLNLNTLLQGEGPKQSTARDRLLAIPGMEDDVADAILDWIDSDSQARDFGAEEVYYESLDPPYEPTNGPLASLDELLQVRGVTPELLYGVDANRNYLVDENERPRGLLMQLDNTNGQLDRGWSAYLTLHSLEKQVDSEGQPKIDVNSADLKVLHKKLETVLDQNAAKFIIAYRQYQRASDDASGTVVDSASLQLDFKKEAQQTIGSLLDLVGARLSVQVSEGAKPQLVESPWKEGLSTYRGELLELHDQLTVGSEPYLAGRVNINQASRPVLLSVPGLSQSAVDQILLHRERQLRGASDDQRHAVWILGQGIVSQEEMKQLEPLITSAGDVYSGQVVGFFDSGSPTARLEVIFDRSGSSTRLVSWNDWTRLGTGFSAEQLGGEAEEDH